MNPFTQLVVAKAQLMFNQLEQSKSITHSGTKGSLREAYIRSFLMEIVPKDAELIGGFITDAFGTITPQIDLIGIEDSLPVIKLDQGTCVAPIEAARFWIEVKSTLKTEHLEQLIDRLNSIDNMVWHLLRDTDSIGFKAKFQPPAFVVAYDSEVARETLEKWLVENQFLYAIVVVGKYALWRATGSNGTTEIVVNNGNNEELLFLSAKIHQMFILTSRILESVRANIARLPSQPTEADITQLKTAQPLDLIHFSLQPYFESEKLIRDGDQHIQASNT